jgi:hypothetical protein
MQETVKQRLIKYIKSEGISINKFEKVCGLSTGYVGNMRVSIQPDKLTNISLNFPQLNGGWLMTGEGEMLKQAAPPPPEPAPINNNPSVESLLNIIAEKDRQIAEKDLQIRNLFELLKTK